MSEPTKQARFVRIRRIRLIAGYTLQAMFALRLTWLLGAVGLGLVSLAWWLRAFNFGTSELKFIGDFGLGVIGFFGALLAALATAQLFFKELADGTIHCVLTRAVSRSDYLIGQLAGVLAMLAIFTAGLGLLVGGLLWWRGAQLGVPPVGLSVLLAACALQWLKLGLVAAMTLLLCTYASSALFASCVGLLLTVVGHWRGFWVADSRWEWLMLWPDFSRFDGEALMAATVPPTIGFLVGLGAYWAGYLVLFGGLACYVFRHREF